MNLTYLHCSRGGGTWEFCCRRGSWWVCCAFHGLCLMINNLPHVGEDCWSPPTAWLLSSPEARAECRPSAPAVPTCSGQAAPASPTPPGVKMWTANNLSDNNNVYLILWDERVHDWDEHRRHDGGDGGWGRESGHRSWKKNSNYKKNTNNKTSLLEKIPPRVWLKCPKIYTFQLVSDLLLLWTPNVTNKQLFIPRTFRWNCYLIRRILISIGQTFTF